MSNAPRGGIAVDLLLMNNVLEIRPDDLDFTVEAGLTLQRMSEVLAWLRVHFHSTAQ